MDLLFFARALGFGGLIGFSLGALGAGGSILTVRILVYAMGVPVQGATGTNLAIVGLNAATGALDHLRHGRSLVRTGASFGMSGVLGAFVLIVPARVVVLGLPMHVAVGTSSGAIRVDRQPQVGNARLGVHIQPQCDGAPGCMIDHN